MDTTYRSHVVARSGGTAVPEGARPLPSSERRAISSRRRRPQRNRWLRRAGVLCSAVLALAGSTALALWRSGLPQLEGEALLPGLASPVEIRRDAFGIPHIVAGSDHDAAMAQGWVHSQDRLWQMEWQRRISAGRLSELIGEETLDIDRFLRTLGVHRAAQRAAEELPERSRRVLQAYADGVNAYLATSPSLPPEFRILRAPRPAPWTPADSIAWTKMLAWNLGGNQQLELLRMRIHRAVGSERADELFPAAPFPVAPSEVPAHGSIEGLALLGDQLRALGGFGSYDAGSNAWVVAGRHTTDGRPIVANDPHLGAQLPSPWYLIELQGDQLHVAGASLPGLPLIAIGRSRHVAWGLTNLGADVQDWVVERLDPATPDQYRASEGWRPLLLREERIAVRGRHEEERLVVRATHNGPLLSDVTEDAAWGELAEEAPTALALRWSALDGGDTTFDAFVGLNHAVDEASIDAALRQWVAPPMNVVWADSKGSIGWRTTGRVPRRADGAGRLPIPGWLAAAEAPRYIAYEELPAETNPPRGYIVSANQRPPAPSTGPFLGEDWAPPFRANRIARTLSAAIEAGVPLDTTQMRAIQHDVGSDYAARLRMILLRVPLDNATDRERRAMTMLARWDGVNRPDDIGPSILQAWQRHLLLAVVDDDLGADDGLAWRAAEGLHRRQSTFLLALLDSSLPRTQGARRETGMVRPTQLASPQPNVLGPFGSLPDARWCDDRGSLVVESCAETAARALTAALDELAEMHGPRMESWRWGDVHRTQLSHAPLSQVRWLRPLVHRSLRAGGDAFSPNAGPVDWSEPYDHTHMPGFRQIVRPGPMDHGTGLIEGEGNRAIESDDRWIFAGGSSGHPASDHYDDQLALYGRGGDIAQMFGREEVTGPVRILILRPDASRTSWLDSGAIPNVEGLAHPNQLRAP